MRLDPEFHHSSRDLYFSNDTGAEAPSSPVADQTDISTQRVYRVLVKTLAYGTPVPHRMMSSSTNAETPVDRYEHQASIYIARASKRAVSLKASSMLRTQG
jgi:hypothetical protein